jgi:hypothetical protein
MGMNEAQIIEGLNQWLDDYENDPEKFEQMWTTIKRDIEEKAAGDSPTYGLECLGILKEYTEKGSGDERASEQSDDGKAVES